MQPDCDSVIKATLTGQIDERIEKLAKKYKQPFPSNYYVSWSSYKGKDPVGKTATAMLDVKLGQKDLLQAYKCYRAEIKSYLSNLDDEQIFNIKSYLKLTGKNIEGYERTKARNLYREIKAKIDDLEPHFN